MTDELQNVPEIVRKQAEEALKLFKAASGQPAGEEKPPVEGETSAPGEEKPEEAEKTAEKAVEKSTEDEKPAPPTSLKDVATDEMTKEQRYKIMEGIQKAAGRDLSRALADNRDLRAQLDAMQAQISALSAAKAVAPTPNEKTAGVSSSELRDQVAEAFGAENVEKFFALMRQEGFVAKPDLDEIRGEVSTVSRNVVQSAQERFQTSMEELAPNWTRINEDPKFIEYMHEEEGRTGMSRLDFAKLHLGRFDAPRLAQYFVDFVNTTDSAPAAKKLDKKKFAAPPSTPPSGKEPEEKGEKQLVKSSDMAQFAREVIIQKYKGVEAAMNEKDAATWKMYLNAQREGRLV